MGGFSINLIKIDAINVIAHCVMNRNFFLDCGEVAEKCVKHNLTWLINMNDEFQTYFTKLNFFSSLVWLLISKSFTYVKGKLMNNRGKTTFGSNIDHCTCCHS